MVQKPRRHAALALAGLLVVLIASAAGPLHAQNAPLPLDDYVELIKEAVQALATAGDAEVALETYRVRFDAVEEVLLPSGEVVAVIPLLSQSADAPPLTPAVALQILRTEQRQLTAAEDDAVTARLTLLEAVLARPEFNSPVGLLERLAIWLGDLFRRWFPNWDLGGATRVSPRLIEMVLWVLAGAGVIAVIVLLAGWVRRLAQSFLAEAEGEPAVGFGDLPRTAAEARQQAQYAAQSGAYRDAVRRLYLAALLQLAETRLLPFDPSLTNREVLARLRTDSPVRPFLEPVVATFDDVWYGMHEPDRTTFDDYTAAINALDHAARQAAAQQERVV